MEAQEVILKDGWLQLQEIAQKSVVQIIVQVAQFNWIEPYKVYDQGESRGTGFFIDDKGYLVTNAHVVEDATRVWIHVPALGRKAIFVDVVSVCPERDLALLKVQEASLKELTEAIGTLHPLVLGDSDSMQRTERVLVLGYPLGQYRMKSSTGVFSGREFIEGRSLIQITAPINMGNSGGPLLNVHGQVVGIALSMIFLSQNVGYAIPINELKIILKDLYEKPLVRKGTLGVRFNYSTDTLAQFLRNPVPTGFYINKVLPHTLLAQAGVQEGDVLYEFNGMLIDGFGDARVPWSYDKLPVYDLIARLQFGEQVRLVLYRAGSRLDIACTFELMPVNPVRIMYPTYESIDYEILGGLVMMELALNHIPLLLDQAPLLVDYLHPEKHYEGAIVITHVFPGSHAQQLHNLMPGFVINQVNGVRVTSLQELRSVIRAYEAADFLTMKTQEHIFAVFPFKQMLADEARLAKTFAYPITDFVQSLLAQEGVIRILREH